jgi:hypothetical protein
VTRAAHAGHTGYHGIEHAKTTTAFQRFGALLRGIALSAQRIRNALRKQTDLLYDRPRLFVGHSRDVYGNSRLISLD